MVTRIRSIDAKANAKRAAKRLDRLTAIQATRFYYERDYFFQAYRVWQSGNPDVPDVIPYNTQDVTALLNFFKAHPDMFVECLKRS